MKKKFLTLLLTGLVTITSTVYAQQTAAALSSVHVTGMTVSRIISEKK